MSWSETIKRESDAQAGKACVIVALLTLIIYVASVVISSPLSSIGEAFGWFIAFGFFIPSVVAVVVFGCVSWALFEYRIYKGVISGQTIGIFSLTGENISSVRTYGIASMIGPNPRNKTAHGIALASCRMPGETVYEIVDGLRNNTTITSFALYDVRPYCDVDSENEGPVGDSQKIDMSKVAIRIADALRKNVTLADLGLAENCEIRGILRNRATYVTRTSVGDPGSVALADTLKTNTTLIRLTLRNCGIARGGAIAIASMLAKNKALRQLDMSYNDIGDGAVVAIGEALLENESLAVFDLTRSEIGDRGALALAAALMTNRILRELVLKENKITCDGAISLARMLVANKTLRVLELSHIAIGDCGAIELSKALKRNASLTELTVAYSGIETHGMRAISDALVVNKTLQDLDVRQGNWMCDETPILKSVALNKGLRTLSVDFSKRANEEILIGALHLNDWITTINCDRVRRGCRCCSCGCSCGGREKVEFPRVQKCLEENRRHKSKAILFRNVKARPDCFVFCCEW